LGSTVEALDAVQECPECQSIEVPHLVVHFGGVHPDGLSWRCRVCHHEWCDGPDDTGVRPLAAASGLHEVVVTSQGFDRRSALSQVAEPRTIRG